MKPAGAFVVDITPLRKQPGSAMHVDRAGRLPGLGITGVEVPSDAEVQVEAHLAWAQEDVVVTATVRAPWASTCRRCLEPATGEAVTRVREVYEPGSTEEETYRLEGTEVDLAPLVRDAVLLHLPPAPLCKEDCRGLCTRCGANLNDGECGCDPGPSDPRWAALDVLKDL
jgi:uncharacterized protein